jgi:hypothetical protein
MDMLDSLGSLSRLDRLYILDILDSRPDSPDSLDYQLNLSSFPLKILSIDSGFLVRELAEGSSKTTSRRFSALMHV